MFNFSKKNSGESAGIQWNVLNNVDLLQTIRAESEQQAVLIFKHSTRCAISATVLNRLERSWNAEEMPLKAYFLDLIAYRNLSNQIETEYGVAHESPQALVIKGGEVIYHTSHFGINYEELKALVS